MALAPDFLDFLSAVVEQDRGAPGFEGTLCFGLAHPSRTRWWEVSIGVRNRGAFVERPSSEVQAAILLPAPMGESIMTPRATIDADGARCFGDTRLLARFIDRYLRQLDMISLRAGSRQP